MNDKEREQWDDFLWKMNYFNSWNPFKNAVVIQPIRLEGNEYVYGRLLKSPHIVMDILRYDDEVFFEGVYYEKEACIARIVHKKLKKIKNYDNKKKFYNDFCRIVMAGKESEVEPVICDQKILNEFTDLVKMAKELM